MTEKTLPEEQTAGSSPADVKPQPQDEIAALKAEMQNVKAVLKSLEAKGQPEPPTTQSNPKIPYEAMKESIKSDFAKIDALVQAGKLNAFQGASLKNYILQKAFGNVYNTKSVQPQAQQEQPVEGIKDDAFAEFEKSNPDFFSHDARNKVKTYMQESLDAVSSDELLKIVDIIKAIEEAAISQYEQSKAREQSIASTNEAAKKRLSSTALSGSSLKNAGAKVFTREEIGKMTTDEFRKNEEAIMQQLRAGQIK